MLVPKTFLLFACFALGSGSFFEVNYPNVNITAEPTGDVNFEAGVGGNIFLRPGSGGTVYIAGVDVRRFITKVKSLPPVWTKTSVHSSLGTFDSGSYINTSVEAKDPDGGNITYEIISGHLPPASRLDKFTGFITGRAPDVDAIYTFGIRAKDVDDKYADGAFSISIRELDQCLPNTCYNAGTCTDRINSYECTCVPSYGGQRCQTYCPNNPLGVGASVASAHRIPDAQMSGHYTYSTQLASDGRLNSLTGWIGEGAGSWLQVDLGDTKTIQAVAAQGYTSTNYYITGYTVSHSIDGNRFSNVMETPTLTFSGSTDYTNAIKTYINPTFRARFVRFTPTAWHTGGRPGMRVEIYGCA
ncbi:hypothetical protein ScPMuIL_011756 [Solemya velum]